MIAKNHEKYWQRGRDFLGVEYPLIAGAMTWISTSGLVRAVAEAGAFGVLAAGNMPAEILEREVKILQKAGCRFAVNLITIAPNYLDHLEKVASWRVPYVVFAGSFPRQEEVGIAKQSGARVLCFASNDSIAERMIAYGADALVLEG
ncbi:MAG: nitronate monooxygenase, partial [Candidatus Aminicenantes bacterium]|nr:nitronate monooxygenase [Candidatus Aminicenantes bacterium]